MSMPTLGNTVGCHRRRHDLGASLDYARQRGRRRLQTAATSTQIARQLLFPCFIMGKGLTPLPTCQHSFKVAAQILTPNSAAVADPSGAFGGI